MNKLMYKIYQLKDKLIYASAGIMSGLLTAIRPENCTDLWSTGADESIIQDVIDLYQKWWWVPALVTLILWLILKEDNKMKPMMKKVLIGLVIAFIATYAYDIIKNSVIRIAEHFQ